jgi:hypothetical protein
MAQAKTYLADSASKNLTDNRRALSTPKLSGLTVTAQVDRMFGKVCHFMLAEVKMQTSEEGFRAAQLDSIRRDVVALNIAYGDANIIKLKMKRVVKKGQK